MASDNIIFVSYGVPCILLYVLTIISILSIRQQLSATFVSIYVLTSIVNMLTYLNVWIILRLINEHVFNFYYHFANATVILSYLNQFLMGHCYYVQNINSFLLTLDRFFSIVSIDCLEAWRKHWWKFAAVLYFLTGVIHFLAAGFNNIENVTKFVYDAKSDSFTSVTAEGGQQLLPWTIGLEAIFGIVFIIFCATLNAITWARLRRIKTANKADRSFFFISLIIFLSQTVNIVILLLWFYFCFINLNMNILLGVVYAMLYTSDVFSLGPGLYTLLIPGPIRRKAFAIIRSCLPVKNTKKALKTDTLQLSVVQSFNKLS